jgi:hypothetical protein
MGIRSIGSLVFFSVIFSELGEGMPLVSDFLLKFFIWKMRLGAGECDRNARKLSGEQKLGSRYVKIRSHNNQIKKTISLN